ncbi:MAG: hemolysin family protein, partial [Proteobacteria bacterium]|nr:hemolysin family protein [Pseudomonadota bacterium]
MDDGSSKGFFARLTNLFPHRNHSAEDFEKEIQTLIAEGEEQGIIQHAEGEMLQSIFDFRDTIVREVMVPRTACVGLSIETPIEEVVAVIIQHGHTRIPVFDGDIDHVLGILHAKDFLQFWGQQIGPDEIRSILRRPSFVPETKLIRDVLSEMRRREEHLAIVIDEYGGTAGLITIEDILEEIVGEIRYEHDQEEPGLVALDDGFAGRSPSSGGRSGDDASRRPYLLELSPSHQHAICISISSATVVERGQDFMTRGWPVASDPLDVAARSCASITDPGDRMRQIGHLRQT